MRDLSSESLHSHSHDLRAVRETSQTHYPQLRRFGREHSRSPSNRVPIRCLSGESSRERMQASLNHRSSCSKWRVRQSDRRSVRRPARSSTRAFADWAEVAQTSASVGSCSRTRTGTRKRVSSCSPVPRTSKLSSRWEERVHFASHTGTTSARAGARCTRAPRTSLGVAQWTSAASSSATAASWMRTASWWTLSARDRTRGAEAASRVASPGPRGVESACEGYAAKQTLGRTPRTCIGRDARLWTI